MFFAARTFSMKLGQTIAMLVYTYHALIGNARDASAEEIYKIIDEIETSGRNISELDLSTKEPDYDSYIQYETRIGEIDYYYTLIKLDNYTVYAFYERTEADFAKIQSTMMNFFMQTMAFGILFVVIYYVTKRRIVNNIKEVNSSLDKITEGQLDTVVDVSWSYDETPLFNL